MTSAFLVQPGGRVANPIDRARLDITQLLAGRPYYTNNDS